MHVALVYRGRYHVREALDFETLAAVLRTGGHRVSLVYDSDTFGVTDNVLQVGWLAKRLSSPERIVARIAAARPDAVIYNVLPSTYAWACDMAARQRQQLSAPVIFVGLHPSLAAERVIRDECVDYAIQGETENVINPLLASIAAGDEPASVGNLWYRSRGDVVQTPRAELVELDALPLPDKELFFPYVSHAYSYCAMVSRGCPYQCTFCEETCSKKLYGSGYYRRKSVDTVMRELIEGKKRYGFREVIFKDSYLSGNKAWLEDLMAAYRREIHVPFKCFCTILGFDDETAALLKANGCYSIEFGLQTWNQRVRRNTLRRRETNEQAHRVFDSCARHRLWYDVDHMFNLPGEGEQDHLDGTLEYRKLRHLNRVKVHFLVYLPTADIIEDGLREDILPDDVHDRLAEGWESDFYDQEVGSDEEKATVAGYAALYKLLPVMPKWLVQWLLKRGRVRWLRKIPSPLMALLQGLMAIRSGDLRFSAYLHFYPKKIWLALGRR